MASETFKRRAPTVQLEGRGSSRPSFAASASRLPPTDRRLDAAVRRRPPGSTRSTVLELVLEIGAASAIGDRRTSRPAWKCWAHGGDDSPTTPHGVERARDSADAQHLHDRSAEEWFHLRGRGGTRAGRWTRCRRRVDLTTRRLLRSPRSRPTSATVFVVGWVAERHPSLIAAVRDAGHGDRIARLPAPARLTISGLMAFAPTFDSLRACRRSASRR